MSTAAIISELALALIQAYMLAAKQAGLTEAQAKTEFESAFAKFMEKSARPVDPVNA